MKFEVGKVYYSSFIGDHSLHGCYKVVRRTPKMVVFYDMISKIEFKVKVRDDKGTEWYSHHGEYIEASKLAS